MVFIVFVPASLVNPEVAQWTSSRLQTQDSRNRKVLSGKLFWIYKFALGIYFVKLLKATQILCTIKDGAVQVL